MQTVPTSKRPYTTLKEYEGQQRGLGGLNYEERLKALKLQSLENEGQEMTWN